MNRRATIYLERSGQQPLTIAVSMFCRGTEKFPKMVWRILCLKRWRKAVLVLVNSFGRDELLRCRENMSSLESLTVSIPDDTSLENYDAFQVGPHLTELDLSHPGFTAEFRIPWAQLTKLKIVTSDKDFDNNGKNLLGVLFQLKNIEQLTIRAITKYTKRDSYTFPFVHLPVLRCLEISLDCATIFYWLTAPLLEHLHIHGINDKNLDYDIIELHEYHIASFIRRSSCHIRRLTLEACRTGELYRIVKAQELASVEELSINYPDPNSLRPFIIQHVRTLDGSIYLPKLQVLQVTCTLNGVEALKSAVTNFSRLLEARGKGLSQVASRDMVPLEGFVLRLTLQGKYPQIFINGTVFKRLTPSL